MWRWIKRWVDWLRNERLPLARIRRGRSSVSIRHEAPGGIRDSTPVPWTADAVIVELLLRLPPAARRRTDFLLRFPPGEPIPADSIRSETASRYRVIFRFPTPSAGILGEILWREQLVARVSVPVLTASTFLAGVTLDSPALAVEHAGQIVPAIAFVAGPRTRLVATALVKSVHPLAPLIDLGLCVVFRNERTGQSWEVSVPLSATQRSSTHMLAAAACPRRLRRTGIWSATWRAGGRDLAVRKAEAVSTARIERGIRMLDARFVVVEKSGSLRMVRQVPAAATADRLGPCFILSLAEAGTVGTRRLSVFATSSGGEEAVHLSTREVLLTDAPTPFAPGLYDAAELARVGGFELRLGNRVLGSVSLSPVPPAALTAEGGFQPPPGFAWTAAAEEELLDRLGRLGKPRG